MSVSVIRGLVCIVACCILAASSNGQIDTTQAYTLPDINVSAIRISESDPQTPYSISEVTRESIQRANQTLSLNESLNSVPGLFTLNADNFAQDLRISIRGFGSRAAFGIRGIKVYVDGIPESTPDGQSQVDNIDPALLNSIQIIRGPSSGNYGNASGGAIFLDTEAPGEKNFLEAQIAAGSFNFQKYLLKGGIRIGRFQNLTYGSYSRTDGFRDHSFIESVLVNSRSEYEWTDSTALSVSINYVNSPTAKDPGGVDSITYAEFPQNARQRNLDYDTRESVEQGRIALRFFKPINSKQQVQTLAYYVKRDFDNKLPFEFGGAVRIDRNFGGGEFSYSSKGILAHRDYRINTGINVDYQADRRSRFLNMEGDIGEMTFDQLETFFNFGAFFHQELLLTEAININFSLRFDHLSLNAKDRFLADGDDSGGLDYQNLSPMIGVLFDLDPGISIFTNVSTNFETPTLSELSSNPDNTGGFNLDLKPQRATNFEIGFKGKAQKIQYSASLFFLRLFNELVPFELASSPNRVFYRNAGSSNRFGAEVFFRVTPLPGLDLTATGSFNKFEYRDYQVNENTFDGNRLPGIPSYFGTIAATYTHPSGLYSKAWIQTTGPIYANDTNTLKLDPYALLNLRLAWKLEFPWGMMEPFLGINNVFDQLYPGNVRINAFGGNYYEAGAPINIFGGVQTRIRL